MACSPSSEVPFERLDGVITQKLAGQNFLLWKAQLTPYLKVYNLEKFIDGTCKSPPAIVNGAPNPLFLSWQSTDKLLLWWIMSSLTSPVLDKVKGCETSHSIWTKLDGLFASKTDADVIHLKESLSSVKKGNSNIHILTEDLLAEILSRLPLRIILQLRCVCKCWSILSRNNPKLIHMKFNLMLLEGEKQLCSLDNDSLSSSLFDGIDGRVKKIRCPFLPLDSDLKDTNFVGSCNGLIYLYRAEKSFWGWKPCLWNPSTQEFIYLPKPGFRVKETKCILNRGHGHGFGYDAKTDDYKCVRIFAFSSGFDSQVHIYSFRSNKWKLIYIPFLLATDHIDEYERAPNGVFCNGALHWFAGMRNSSTKVLFAFDIADEGTKIIPEPENLGVEKFGPRKHIDMLDGCLCMLYSNRAGFEVWLMKDYGIRESWTQAYNILELTPIIKGAAQTVVHLKKVQ